MKIIQIPAVKQLVNISIMLIQALSKTCWRIFKESFPATGPLHCSYQSATICQKFQRMLQPCLLPSGAQHDKLNPIIDYHISSTQVFFVIFGTKNHCQNQRVHQSQVPWKHLFIEESSWLSFTHHQKTCLFFCHFLFQLTLKLQVYPI